MTHTPIPDTDLRRFASLAAPLLQGAAAYGYGPRASRNRAGRGLEFLDTRPYEPGDEFRSIDWRQSARGENLVVRRYQEETTADWFVCIDRSASVAWGGRKWQMTLRLASALSYTLLHAGHRVALVFWSDRVHNLCELGRGTQHFSGLLRTLIAHRPALPGNSRHLESSNLGVCRPLVTRNSNVFVLSDFLASDGMQAHLHAITARAASVNAVQILDAAETHVPVRGNAALRDTESGEVRNLELTDSVEHSAGLALREHNDTLAKTCRGLGIRFTSCFTEQAWQKVLLKHLRSRG